jgi:hypothetical protein
MEIRKKEIKLQKERKKERKKKPFVLITTIKCINIRDWVLEIQI